MDAFVRVSYGFDKWKRITKQVLHRRSSHLTLLRKTLVQNHCRNWFLIFGKARVRRNPSLILNYLRFSNVSTHTTVILKEKMLNEKSA